ncbi:MAG TPA: hypothetical protein PK612_02565, partial [Bacilli bacterium]|nr:hypothetical protein [Bacilli bacterium]
RLNQRLTALFQQRGSHVALILLTVSLLPGILRLHANDDLRLLQAPEASISAMEKRVQTLTELQSSGRFFLIEGDTQEQLLQRSEQLGDWLHAQFPLASVDLITRYLPSQQRQQENFQLLKYPYRHKLHLQVCAVSVSR